MRYTREEKNAINQAFGWLTRALYSTDETCPTQFMESYEKELRCHKGKGRCYAARALVLSCFLEGTRKDRKASSLKGYQAHLIPIYCIAAYLKSHETFGRTFTLKEVGRRIRPALKADQQATSRL